MAAPLIVSAVRTIVEPTLNRDWMAADQDAMQRVIAGLKPSDQSTTLELLPGAIDVEALSIEGQADDASITITRPLQLRRRSAAQILSVDGQTVNQASRIDRALVRNVVLARKWAQMLESGAVKSVSALAKAEGHWERNVTRILPLAFLAPDLIELILAGRQPASLTVSKLLETDLPFTWADQRALFAQYA